MVHMLQNYDVFLQFCVSKRNQRNMVFIVHAAFESLKAFHSDILPPNISDAPNNHFNYKQIHSIKSEWSLTYSSHGLYPRQLPMFHSLCFKQCAFFSKTTFWSQPFTHRLWFSSSRRSRRLFGHLFGVNDVRTLSMRAHSSSHSL